MNLKGLFFAIVILVEFVPIAGIFKSKFNKIKERAKQYYQKNFKKDRTWHFMNDDPAAYPGTDDKYRQENQEKWDLYYECLKEQEKSLGAHGTPVPEAVLGYEGGSAKFDCKLCLSPKEQSKLESVEWYYGDNSKQYLEAVFYDEHIMLAPEDKSLRIYNLAQSHTGQYVCILGDSVTVPYYLTVANESTKVIEVHPGEAPNGPYPEEPDFIEKYNIIIETEWGPWSPCNKCKDVGRRHRVGYCNIIHNFDANTTTTSNTTTTTSKSKITKSGKTNKTGKSTKTAKNKTQSSTTASKKVKRDTIFRTFKDALLQEDYKLDFKKMIHKNKTSTNVTKLELDLLQIFVYGIPCRSYILPQHLKVQPKLLNRSDEVMVAFCKEDCDDKVFQVRDKKGNVIETANNSAGVYSTLQGVPPDHPPVERSLQYERLGKNIVIMCPGNINSDAPILWQINSKNLVPEVIHKESEGRIYISLLDRIHIQKAKIADSNLYSCWQLNELAGVIRLVVEKEVKLTFHHHIMLTGMLAILGTFIYVFVRAFLGRKYAKLGTG